MERTDGVATLRRFRDDDVPRIVEACSDPDTARFIPLIPVPYGGVERLTLTTHPETVASQRVAEKAGFVREGVLRAHIRFREGRRDSVLFSLIPPDLTHTEAG